MKSILLRTWLVLLLLACCNSLLSQKFLYNTTSEVGTPDDKVDSVAMGPTLFVKFDNNALSGLDNDQFIIQLPGESFTRIIKKEREIPGAMGFTWVGKIRDQPSSFVMITQVKNVFTGQIRSSSNKFYAIEYKGKAVHRVSTVNQDRFRGDLVLNANITNTADYLKTVQENAAKCCEKDTIDIMVLFTAPALSGARGMNGMNSLILQCKNLTNESFRKSKINAHIEIVHSQVFDFTESGSVRSDRELLLNGTRADKVRVLRDKHAADIVMLIVENSGSEANTGIAAVMEEISPAFESQAFCVIRRDAAFRDLVFPHEIGHILGARHHCSMDWLVTPHPYSHGYYTNEYSSIMAKMPGTLRVEYWSDTSYNFPGSTELAGTSTGTGQSQCQAMDAKTLRETISVVSKFRCKSFCIHDKIEPRKADPIKPDPEPLPRPVPVPAKTFNYWWIIATVLITGILIWFFIRKKKTAIRK